jgi:hypothetical protein
MTSTRPLRIVIPVVLAILSRALRADPVPSSDFPSEPLRLGQPLYAASNPGPDAADPATGLHFSLEGSFLIGPANGYVQTPAGGQSGTTSARRPKLDEIGIDTATIYDVAGATTFGPHQLYLGAQFIRLSGNATLDQPLVTQGQTFPAGTPVSSELTLDWYRAGYRYAFTFDTDSRPGDELLLAPSVGAALLDFHYRLHSRDGAGPTADRSYSKLSPQLGLDAEYALTPRLSLVGDVLCSVPLSNTPFILSAELAAKYRVIDTPHADLDALLGVAYEHISYEDNQSTPNHVNVDLGPMLLLGLTFHF